MMDALTRTLRKIQGGAVARLLLADILELAEREGVLEQVRRLSPVSFEGLCAALCSDLGYALDHGNRRRMISLVLDLLRECRWVSKVGGAWVWRDEAAPANCEIPQDTTPGGNASSMTDDQYLFFRRCLEAVPAYLRGGDPTLLFDDRNAAAWELFLGCTEFRTCRALLLKLMGIGDVTAPRLLDLCHGPGWDLEAIITRHPATRITAADFTEAFRQSAGVCAKLAQDRSRRLGHAVPPITWVGPERWKGFGDPLPFPDGSFDVVFFSCGDPYIPMRLRREVYRDVARVLTPGGTLGVLTRSRPDAAARHVPSFWLRIAALTHDFAESVCEGWEGFAEAEENARVFAAAGFQGGGIRPGAMSFLESSLWVLRKRHPDE